MKKLMMTILLVATLLSAWAADVWVKNTTNTTSAVVIFPAVGNSRVRVTGLMGKSDKATSVWNIRSGVGEYTLTATNASTGTNIFVSNVSGLVSNDVIILQNIDGTCTSAIVWGTNNVTNLIVTAAIGVNGAIGDKVYELGTAQTINVGAATVNYQGNGYHVSRGGVPVRIILDGTSACSIDAATAIYE